jgi:hypothetical protein
MGEKAAFLLFPKTEPRKPEKKQWQTAAAASACASTHTVVRSPGAQILIIPQLLLPRSLTEIEKHL